SILLAQQTHQQLNQPTGLDLDNIVLVQLKPTTASLRVYPALEELLNRQLAAVSALPDVVAAAYSNQSAILQGGNNGNVYIDGEEDRTNQPSVPMYFVSKDFFNVLNSDVLQGELPQHSVSLDNPVQPDVVITKSLADKLFAGKPAVGKQLNRGRVAAVISDFYGQRHGTDVMFNNIQVAPPYSVDWGYGILLRVQPGQAENVRQQVDKVLRNVEPNIEILHVRTLAEQYQRRYRNEYGLATLLALLSALMLLVTMVSSYSSTHFHALKRQQEIGVKRALGASKKVIFLELLSENWLCTAIGALFGIGCAL